MNSKGFTTDFTNTLKEEASSEADRKSSSDEETAKATEKDEDPEVDVAKHSSDQRSSLWGRVCRTLQGASCDLVDGGRDVV